MYVYLNVNQCVDGDKDDDDTNEAVSTATW